MFKIKLRGPTSAKERRWLARQMKNFKSFSNTDEFKEFIAQVQTEIAIGFSVPEHMLLGRFPSGVEVQGDPIDNFSLSAWPFEKAKEQFALKAIEPSGPIVRIEPV